MKEARHERVNMYHFICLKSKIGIKIVIPFEVWLLICINLTRAFWRYCKCLIFGFVQQLQRYINSLKSIFRIYALYCMQIIHPFKVAKLTKFQKVSCLFNCLFTLFSLFFHFPMHLLPFPSLFISSFYSSLDLFVDLGQVFMTFCLDS